MCVVIRMGMAMAMAMVLGNVIVIGILLYLRNFYCFLLNVGCRWGVGWISGGRVNRG